MMKVRWGLLGLPLVVLLIDIPGVLADGGKPFGMDRREKWTTRGKVQMPPTSTNRIDDAGAGLLREWIGKLPVGLA
jgi:hypothetical protein